MLRPDSTIWKAQLDASLSALDATAAPCYHLSDPRVQERAMAEADDQQTIQVGTYTRTIQARAVTFQCAHCGQETTVQQYPGYAPRYCSADCKRAVHRVRDRERKARQRAAARAAESVALSDSLGQPSDTRSGPPSPESLSDTSPRLSDRGVSSDTLPRVSGTQPLHHQRIWTAPQHAALIGAVQMRSPLKG
jgi:hypothetical protein